MVPGCHLGELSDPELQGIQRLGREPGGQHQGSAVEEFEQPMHPDGVASRVAPAQPKLVIDDLKRFLQTFERRSRVPHPTLKLVPTPG